MQRKKDLVWAVHNRREPLRHLMKKTVLENSVVNISQEFLEKKCREILRNFTKLIILFNSPKNP